MASARVTAEILMNDRSKETFAPYLTVKAATVSETNDAVDKIPGRYITVVAPIHVSVSNIVKYVREYVRKTSPLHSIARITDGTIYKETFTHSMAFYTLPISVHHNGHSVYVMDQDKFAMVLPSTMRHRMITSRYISVTVNYEINSFVDACEVRNELYALTRNVCEKYRISYAHFNDILNIRRRNQDDGADVVNIFISTECNDAFLHCLKYEVRMQSLRSNGGKTIVDISEAHKTGGVYSHPLPDIVEFVSDDDE